MDANLASWNATIKTMRDSLKLDEIEMIFNDGSKRKIWKVNRVKPEVTETVDFVSCYYYITFSSEIEVKLCT